MRIFEHFNKSTEAKCPICKTDEDKQTILVPIPGTEEGYIVEAQQMHWSCFQSILELVENE